MISKNNKGRRQELKMLKFKKRMKNLGLVGKPGNFYAYRSHGKPCSCWMCSPYKYNRAVQKSALSETNPVSHASGIATITADQADQLSKAFISKPAAGWQICPKCNGSGTQVMTMTSSNICDTCKGRKIISVATGLPPTSY
ncbi:hypothetical protein A0256_23225 [Mucilaginibacter sp. PAMC 26640]|nr:hypothetical protein A0256_23225 [Mucilaginibacter sp. PAMC 26640]